jgi:thiopeptide-type bacteriocin biosynthesis protein
MKLRPISSFLWRAPLLPVRALRRPGAALRAHPLGAEAVALASPDLAAALARGEGARTREALDRYGRRAAFRPTPHGLLAGVGVGKLGPRTAFGTGDPRPYRTVAWGKLAALGRELLDDPATRAEVKLRAAPSLLVEAGEAVWLAFGDEGPLELRHAEVDGPLAAVLEVAMGWVGWAGARAAAGAGFSGDEEAPDGDDLDDFLLLLIDQGLLDFDLRPPLVGPPPLGWMQARLERVGTPAAAEARGRLEPVAAVLLHEGKALLSREVVDRAAALAPLLFRLQEALAPPAAERDLGGALAERLANLAELLGAGPFDVGALATGVYGDAVAAVDEDPPAATPPETALLAHLVDALTEAARAGDSVVELDPAALDELLPLADPPPTFELILTPSASPAKRRAGRGAATGKIAGEWLLGLHAPAGASWGRYAHALGAPMSAALAELAAAEAAAGLPAADVSYAPSADLADLCAHPPARRSALALVGWPDGEAIAPRQLCLSIDPAAPPCLWRRGEPVHPSPLHRVRSTTAPAGLYRLLAGWSFVRQHAPWALAWGALGDLPRLPRVRLGGFVVSPASWRIPAAGALAGAGLRRWRAAGEVPRHVQVGEGDELLLVDLEAPGAARDLARHAGARAHEVWPPLDALVDEGGRRIEAVVGVVVEEERVVPRPAHVVPARAAPHWTTFKLFGAEERQDEVLLAAVEPLIGEGQASGAIERWHFLRYVEGTRHHLRLRVRAEVARGTELFARRLRALAEPLRLAGDLIAVETAEYFPEAARYGGAETLGVVERLFELDSELVLRLLSVDLEAVEPLEGDRLEWLVRGFDALARGLGLELEARQALAARRRRAHLPASTRELDADYRARQRRLAATLAGNAADPLTAPLDAYALRAQAIAGALSPPALAALLEALPPLLHVNAVRLLGARPEAEAAAYLYWERALEGLAARRRKARVPE